MDCSFLKSFSLISHLVFASFMLFPPSVKPTSNYSSLVYSKCANQTYTITSPESHSQTLSTLFQQLLEQPSSHPKFYKSTAGDTNLGISGFLQCRADLGNKECRNCINKLPEASNRLCDGAVAARVQLSGCYFDYETDGFSLLDKTDHNFELLHKKCSKKKAVVAGFAEAKEAAFAAMESEMVNENKVYEKYYYDYVYVVAECEGDFEVCDCSECISRAVEIAMEECGASISGQVYLSKCSLRYSYSPDGIPGDTELHPDDEEKGGGSGRVKMIAIVVGGAAALLGGFVFLKLIKSCCGKKEDI